MPDSDPIDPDFHTLPPRLASDLASLYPPPVVGPAVDQRILNSARAALSGRPRRSFRWTGLAAAVAAMAAAVVIVFRLIPHSYPVHSVAQQQPATAPAIAGDLDGNGRVDILDAFIVARALAEKGRSSPLPAAWDVNHDGIVDQKDVDWLAAAAVRVRPGNASDRFNAIRAELASIQVHPGSMTLAQAMTPQTPKGAAE